ncbi:MAG TPA: hypothetical protein VHQ01_02545, partial [Pyrinomonadaceae bacterium]|nr:hypothetical protein [Pyrinomonadaceae bacterium]
YTVQLLKIVGGRYMREGDLTSVLHIWNTGNANGKTYHEDYVTNALKVKKAYEALIADNPFTVSAAAPAVDPIETQSDPSNSADDSTAPSSPDIVQPPTQNAEQIINTGDVAAPAPPPQDVTLNAPAAMGTTATGAKITVLGITVPTFLVVAAQTVGGWIRDGYIDGKAIADTVLSMITANTKYIMLLLVALMGLLAVKKILRELVFLVTVISHMFPTLNNVTVVAPEPVQKRWWQVWR